MNRQQKIVVIRFRNCRVTVTSENRGIPMSKEEKLREVIVAGAKITSYWSTNKFKIIGQGVARIGRGRYDRVGQYLIFLVWHNLGNQISLNGNTANQHNQFNS